MKKLCFLSTDNLEGYVIDDELAIAPLNALGYEVEAVSWHEDRDWNDFELVLIRTTWDYHHTPGEFLNTLKEIDSKTHLENSFELVKWNLEKTYLNELAEKGINTVPTIFSRDRINALSVNQWRSELSTDKLVIKPGISATAFNTILVETYSPELNMFENTLFMVQPLMERIASEGEYSLFYFDRQFSHAVLKTPKRGDFRVQEDFGGLNEPVRANGALREFGANIVECLDQAPLYARVDVVRDKGGEFALMELELIEPALYFRYDKEAPTRFAERLDSRINEL